MIEHSSASLKDALYSLVAEYAGVSCVVIHANENNAVEPTGVYCMIRTMASKIVAYESRNAISADGNLQKTVLTKQDIVRFSFRGSDSDGVRDDYETFVDSLHLPSVRYFISKKGLSYSGIVSTNMLNLPTLVSTESICEVDVLLSYNIVKSYAEVEIERIEATLKTNAGDFDTPLEFEYAQ